MSFQTGLSGLNASSRSLDVIGNNIANANTTGMKSSRAEFGDLVASSLGAGGGGNGPGIGVAVDAIAQQFTQGNISTTGNSLDVAINGGGFFQLKQTDGSAAYTRDGSFKLDKDGYIKTNSGANVMGLPTDVKGVTTSGTIAALKLPTSAPIGAKQTDAVRLRMNLDARATVAAGDATVTPQIPSTPRSTYGTSINVYDAAGVASPTNLYFEKQAAANTWNVYGGLDTPAVVGPPAVPAVTFPVLATLVFNNAGQLTSPLNPNAPSPPKFAFELPPGTVPSQNPNESIASGGDTFIDQKIVVDLGETAPTSQWQTLRKMATPQANSPA